MLAPEIIAVFSAIALTLTWMGNNEWAHPIIVRAYRRARKMVPGYRQATLLEQISKELKTNGGSSIKDAVARIEEVVRNNSHTVQVISHKQELIASVLDLPIFETDAGGKCVKANEAYLRFSGLALEEVVEHGWRNVVADEEKEGVFKEWQYCVDQKRDFHRIITYVHVDTGVRTVVKVDAYAVRGNGDVVAWIGYLTPVAHRDMD
jgi:PAS domain S-box-containing protein